MAANTRVAEIADLPRVETQPLAEPEFQRHGDECALCWPGERVVMVFSALHDGRSGPTGELAVECRGEEIHWASLSLASTAARETVLKKLGLVDPLIPWRPMLERACRLTALELRLGEPLVRLTGRVTSPTRELVPRLLYEGQPTLVFADGNTGKSLFAMAIATAVHAGVALPGLKPVRSAVAAYLDWEADRDTHEERLGLIAAGLGITPPEILYKPMNGPLVNEVRALAAEFSRRRVGLVIVDSMMFAVSTGDGAAFHEPITAFYNCLRLFAPAAALVLNHVTNQDARTGAPGRPFGGAFAFNGPRLVWEARRDKEITDATAIVFTCTKANNLPRKPEPFALRFDPQGDAITIAAFDVTEASPETVVTMGTVARVKLALARGPRTVEALAEELQAKEDTIRKTLQRQRDKLFAPRPETDPQQWALVSRRP